MNPNQDTPRHVVLLAPGLALVEGQLALEHTAEGGGRELRFIVVRPHGSPPVVIQLEDVPGEWPRDRATAWNLPPGCEPVEERLRGATTPERARAVLGAGTGPTWRLFEQDQDLGLGPDPDDWPPARWKAAGLDDLLPELFDAMPWRLDEWATAHLVELDASGFRPLAAAIASGGFEDNGVEVLGWESIRLVGLVRFAGEEALAVADVRAVNDEDFRPLIRKGRLELRVVPRTGAADAARIALSHDPGLWLRDDQDFARPATRGLFAHHLIER